MKNFDLLPYTILPKKTLINTEVHNYIKGLYDVNPGEELATIFCLCKLADEGNLRVSDQPKEEGFEYSYIINGLSKTAYIHVHYKDTKFGSLCKDEVDYLLNNLPDNEGNTYLRHFISELPYWMSYDIYLDNILSFFCNEIYPNSQDCCNQTDSSRFFKKIVPNEVKSIMKWIIGQFHPCTAFDPFAGLGSFVDLIPSECSFLAQEEDFVLSHIGQSLLKKYSRTASMTMCNSLSHWPHEQFDLIISGPLFGENLNAGGENATSVGRNSFINLFIEKSLNSLSVTGQMLCLVPASFLVSKDAEKERSKIMERNKLDMVMLLPNHLFPQSSVATALLRFRNNRDVKDPVLMVNAKLLYSASDYMGYVQKKLDVTRVQEAILSESKNVSKLIPAEVINKHGFWAPPTYVCEQEDLPLGYKYIMLDVLMKEVQRGAAISKEDISLPFLMPSGLSKDWTNCELDLKGLTPLGASACYCYKICGTSIVISSKAPIKPTIVYATPEKPVLIDSQLIALEPVAPVDLHYVCMALSKLKMDAFNEYIAWDQMIAIPEFSMQHTAYLEAVSEANLAKVRESGLWDFFEQKKKEYQLEIRNRKHDMKTPMTQLRNTFVLIEAFAKSLPKESSAKLCGYIQKQKIALDMLSSIVQHLADEEVFATPQAINIDNVLQSFVEISDNRIIYYTKDKWASSEGLLDSPKVMIGETEFKRLVQNIIDNAFEHGFPEGGKGKIPRISISLSVENGFYVIYFENNGKPFPVGMDKDKYATQGVKGVDSKGTGTGGYLVKSITEYYGGSFDIYSDQYANRSCAGVIVKLPIYIKDE